MEAKLLTRVETITPPLAEEYLKKNTHNRPIRQNVVDFYAEQMKKGLWLLNGEAITFDKTGSLVNGQHRLRAVIKSGCGVDFLVVRGADEGSYVVTDSGMTRKLADVFSVDGIPNAASVSSIINKYLALKSDLCIMNDAGRYKNSKTKSKQEILGIYLEDEDFWNEITKMSMRCRSALRILNIAEIGATISYLIKERGHSKEKVYTFFEDLCKNEIPQNPMLGALRNRLIKNQLSTSHLTGQAKQQLIVKYWNKYIKGEHTLIIRWSEEVDGKKNFI